MILIYRYAIQSDTTSIINSINYRRGGWHGGDLPNAFGTIRAILDILKNNRLLDSNREGHYLSPKGILILKKIKNNIDIKEISLKIFPDKKKIAVHIKTLKIYFRPIL